MRKTQKEGALDTLTKPFKYAGKQLDGLAGAALQVPVTLGNHAKDALTSLPGAAKDVSDFVTGLPGDVKNLASGDTSGIKNLGNAAGDFIKSIPGAAVDAVKEYPKSTIDTLTTGVGDTFKNLGSAASSLMKGDQMVNSTAVNNLLGGDKEDNIAGADQPSVAEPLANAAAAGAGTYNRAVNLPANITNDLISNTVSNATGDAITKSLNNTKKEQNSYKKRIPTFKEYYSSLKDNK